jgi:hypothetical protein
VIVAVKKAATEVEDTPALVSVDRPSPAASTDPAVHQLLAHRQSAQLNDDAGALAEVDRQLAELGY